MKNNNIIYNPLLIEDLNLNLFSNFNRYQDVKKCWRKENDTWLLKNIAFIEEWDKNDYLSLIEKLKAILSEDGYLIGAFLNNSLVGFIAIERELFGLKKDYINLSEIYVSSEIRNAGIGKVLFDLGAKKARDFGGKKLYISAHSSQESQGFYKSLGCLETMEYNHRLFMLEPYDCHLEFDLNKK